MGGGVTLSRETISLLPIERTLRLVRESRFSMRLMRLLKRERSVSFVRFSSFSIFVILLKDRSWWVRESGKLLTEPFKIRQRVQPFNLLDDIVVKLKLL